MFTASGKHTGISTYWRVHDRSQGSFRYAINRYPNANIRIL